MRYIAIINAKSFKIYKNKDALEKCMCLFIKCTNSRVTSVGL